MLPRSKRRVLLVEFVNADQFPGRLNLALPFIRAHFGRSGTPTRWIRFGISTTNLLEHDRDEITLNDDELGRLIALVEEHRPNLIVLTDPLYQAQLEQLRAHAPGVRFGDTRGHAHWLPRLLFTPWANKGYRSILRAGLMPRYDWEPGNAAAANKEIDNIYLMQMGSCGHRWCLSDNPVYEGIRDKRVARRVGCSFCSNWKHERPDSRFRSVRRRAAKAAASPGDEPTTVRNVTPSEWIRLQIEGIAQSRGTPERYPNAILLERLGSQAMLRQCLESMRDNGMLGRVQLLMAVRPDQAPRVERLLREHFAEHPDSQLTAGVYASGIESFSARDLELFNKGTRPLDCLRAVNAYRRLELRHPGRFWYTGLSFILFTPWTRPESLHLNVGLMRFLELDRKEAGNMFQSRLRLHPRLPITCLAERDGLVLDDEADATMRMNRRKLFDDEVAWRFADERLRPVSRVVLRYDLLQGELSDSLTEQVERRLLEANPNWTPGRDDELLDFLLCQVDVARAEPQVMETETLLDQALALWLDKRAAASAQPPAERFRVGEQRLDLPGLLARLVPLVAKGLKPVLSVDDVAASEFGRSEPLLPKGLHAALVDEQGRSGCERGTLFVAGGEELLAQRIELQGALNRPSNDGQRAAAALEAARLHGYPECCAGAFVDGPFADVGLPVWAAIAKRAEVPNDIPPANNPLLVPSASFVPCTPDCSRAEATYRAWFEAIGVELDAGSATSAHVFSLAGSGDGELVSLSVAGSDEQSLRYRPDSIRQGSSPLRERLRGGDLLRFVPGQIRVFRRAADDGGEELVDLMTATHGVWYSDRCWHPDEWRELANAAAILARRGRRQSTRR